MLRRHKLLWVLGILVAMLVVVRAALPFVIKDWVNRKLVALEAYDGHVTDIDLALWRGAYAADGVRIVKTGSNQPEPFFDAERVDMSIEWRNLLHEKLVAECKLWKPRVNLIRADSKEQSQL